MDSDRARTLLTAELSELDENARAVGRARRDATAGPESSAYLPGGRHLGDRAAGPTGRMDADLLVDTVAEQRRHVLDALTRLDDGSYGRCAVCGREIDDERLEARPEVVTCREHADTPAIA